MAASANEVWLLKRLAWLAHDTYARSARCNEIRADSVAQVDLNALEAAWRMAQLELERVDPQPAME